MVHSLGVVSIACPTCVVRLTTPVRSRPGSSRTSRITGDYGKAALKVPAVDRGRDAGTADLVADLFAEVSELRTALARAEAGREAAEAIRRAKVAALRELADRLTAELVAVAG